jgi:WD40 repeat protein
MAHGPRTFFRAIETEARADTPSLLSAIVNDSRFTRADWPSLAMLLKLVNSTIPVPLVDWRAVYDNQPDLDRPDQRETLTVWRNLLRRHFGGAALPTAAPVPTSVRTVSKPAWLVESGRARFDWAVMSLSSDGRMLATDGVEDRTIAVRSTESGELLSRLRAPAGARWVLAAFATGAATPTLFFSAGTNRLGIGGSNAGGALEAEGITANGIGAVDRALTRYAYATGVYDLKGAKNLWRFHDNSSGQRGQVAISADGRLAAVGAGNWPQLVRLFDAASGVLLHEIVEFSSPVVSLALTPDGEFLAAASQSDGVRLWDTRTGSIRHRLAYPVGASRVARPVLAVSPDGRWLAVAYRSRIGVFSVSSGELRWEIQLGEGNDASAMLFSIDGTHLYTAGDGLAAWRLD